MYLQIMEQIRHRIAVGDWEPGRELPSIRALAASVQVSVITVKRAYLELEREGVIVTRHGIGSFVAGLLVVGLDVDYRRQVAYRSAGLCVTMTVDDVKAASFRIAYALHDGPGEDAPVAITAHTRMATFDLAAQRPRRLSAEEREWLGRWAA